MKFSLTSIAVVALAAQGTVASTWFGNAVYNKWHETELDRWLTDHNIPHPKASERKDLENLVKNNWDDKVVYPYKNWDAQTIQNYLTLKGYQAKEGTKENTNSLLEQVKSYWTETEESANQAYGNVRDWIFDTWTDSQLKAFADKHGIPVPQPRKRDTLLASVRDNYQTAANKLSETAAYPGDWLYETWSDSELKAWLDERGIPAPQPSSRDKLVASVRRNARIGSLNMQSAYASASKSAANAQQSLTDALLNSWSDSQIKEWADKNGIPVPQGSKRNELLALARKHRARLTGDNVSAQATSVYGAASTKAGNQYAQATDGFAGYTNWIKAKIGIATDQAAASASSASVQASKAATSLTGAAAKSAASASSSASKAAQKAQHRAEEQATHATNRVKEEL